MYKYFYGLTTKPFHITPDLDFLFLSHNHQKAITCMEFGVLEDTGIILLTGDIGTGKTTLIRHILTKFEDDVHAATIYNTNVNSSQLLGIIMEAFGIDTTAQKKAKVLKLLQSGLEKMHANGKKPVLIFDDAQNLSKGTLEEIRLLSNLQSHDRMLVQIILVGQTEFQEKLNDPAIAALAQRIGITYHIAPFNPQETKAYIGHRLEIAGGKADIFDNDAIDKLFEITQGNPRGINLICDHALVYGFADAIKTINSDIICEVLKDNPGLGAGNLKAIKPDPRPNSTNIESTGNDQDLQVTEPQSKQESGNWQQRIEERLQTLEQLMAEYNKELRNVIKTMFEKERQKNDDLTLKYAQLQVESKALKQKLADKRCDCRLPIPNVADKSPRPDLTGDM